MTRARNTAKRTDYRCGPTRPVHADDEPRLCRKCGGVETWHRRETIPIIPSEGAPYLRANYICRSCEGENTL
jgi:ribosomal protein L40E